MLITMEDISEGGCRLKTAIPLPVGQRATLSWKIGEEKEIIADVEVVWRFDATRPEAEMGRSPGMGVRILKVHKGIEDLRKFMFAVQNAGTIAGDALPGHSSPGGH